MALFIIGFVKGILLATLMTKSLLNIFLHAWLASATLRLKWWLGRGPPPLHQLHHVFALSTTMLPTSSWNCVTTLLKKSPTQNFFAKSAGANSQNVNDQIYKVANKWCIWMIITACGMKFIAQIIVLDTKLCTTYRISCRNYILIELEIELNNTNYVNRVLLCIRLFNERIWTTNNLKSIAIYRKSQHGTYPSKQH